MNKLLRHFFVTLHLWCVFIQLQLLWPLAAVAGYTFAVVPKTTENPFFLMAQSGCEDYCSFQFNNCTCLYGGTAATDDNQNPDPDGSLQAKYVQKLVDSQSVDGLAISVKNSDLMVPIIDEASKTIPVLTFDSDAPESSRISYIGTDNYFMGQTLANVAKQVTPTGGTFVVISPDDSSPNIVDRGQGFRDEMEEPSSQGTWTELVGSPVVYNRDLDNAFSLMEVYAQQNPTVMVFTSGGPFFHDNYDDFYRRHRNRNITIVSADDFDAQLHRLSKGYVHGLVGQTPFEMGCLVARLLHMLVLNQGDGGKPTLIPEKIGTNLITHVHVPLILPELQVDHNLIERLRIIGYTLLGVIVATTLSCGAWTWSQRNRAVVKAAQPTFLLMIVVGVLLFAATIVPLSLDDNGDATAISEERSTWICQSAPWLCCCGLAVTFSALFSKTIRINKIVEETRHCHRVKVTACDVLAPFSALMSLNVLVLIVWSALDPLVYVRSNDSGLDGWSRVISTYGGCQCENAWPYVAPLGAVNLGVLILANWQAYRARKIRCEFAESKYIAICMLLLLQALLIGVPILLVVRNSPQAFYLTICFMIFVICMGVVLLIFVPKIAIAADYSQRSIVEQQRMLLDRIRDSANATSSPRQSGSTSSPKSGSTLPTIECSPEHTTNSGTVENQG